MWLLLPWDPAPLYVCLYVSRRLRLIAICQRCDGWMVLMKQRYYFNNSNICLYSFHLVLTWAACPSRMSQQLEVQGSSSGNIKPKHKQRLDLIISLYTSFSGGGSWRNLCVVDAHSPFGNFQEALFDSVSHFHAKKHGINHVIIYRCLISISLVYLWTHIHIYNPGWHLTLSDTCLCPYHAVSGRTLAFEWNQ